MNLRSLPIIPVALESQKNCLLKVEKMPVAAKNIPRQDFMVMNISCKFEKVSYNIFDSIICIYMINPFKLLVVEKL